MRRLIVAVTLALAVALLTPPANATSSDTGEMSVERAGTYLINQLCKRSRASDVFYKKVWRGHKTISLSDVRRRLPEVKRHTRAFAEANFDLALALENPPAAWPAVAAA